MSEDKPRDVLLPGRCFKEASSVCNRWSVVLEPNHQKSDLMNPRFFANMAVKMANGDIIEVRTENETAYGEFIVVESSRIHAKVQELSWHELGKQKADVTEIEYAYKWRGPQWRHCVVRVSDQHCMVDNLPSKDAALQWIRSYKAQAA